MTEPGKNFLYYAYIGYAWSDYKYPNKENSDIYLDNKGP